MYISQTECDTNVLLKATMSEPSSCALATATSAQSFKVLSTFPKGAALCKPLCSLGEVWGWCAPLPDTGV